MGSMGRVAVSVTLLVVLASAAYAGRTSRVSVATSGTESDAQSARPAMSANGRYVAFQSEASSLVPGDTNHWCDAFVHDRWTGRTRRVSVATDGSQGNWDSDKPSVSADGRYVAFHSLANNLVPEDTSPYSDIFVRDRQTGQTTRVSVASDGTQADGYSDEPSISGDGRYVAFSSGALNLAPGDTNSAWDVFVHDRQTGQTTRVSVASDGTQSSNGGGHPSITADGRYVAFHSYANDLVPGDTNGTWDVFVHDCVTGQTTWASVASDGTQGKMRSVNPSISTDGRYVVFESRARNLVPGDTNWALDVFVHDRQTGETTRVSIASNGTQGNGDSWLGSTSADGRYVAFGSRASNLVPGDTNGKCDVFVHDRQTGVTALVSAANDGVQGDGESDWPSVSGDGRFVAFHSLASNLVSGDTNGEPDIFVRQRWGKDSLQPDMLVQKRRWVGDGVYNDTGADQTARQAVAPRHRATYYLRLQNDGERADWLWAQGNGSDPYWRVRYFDRMEGGNNITAAVVGRGWRSPRIRPGEWRDLRVEIISKLGAPADARLVRRVRTTSELDERQCDVVKLVTRLQATSSGTVVTALSAVPAGRGAQVTFTLSAAARVEARVLNIAGRPVKTIAREQDCPAGVNTVVWTGLSDAGLQVPNGRYVVEVRAHTEEGSKSRAIAGVQVGR